MKIIYLFFYVLILFLTLIIAEKENQRKQRFNIKNGNPSVCLTGEQSKTVITKSILKCAQQCLTMEDFNCVRFQYDDLTKQCELLMTWNHLNPQKSTQGSCKAFEQTGYF